MTTAQLVLIIALALVAVLLVALILWRGSQRREEHRTEAAGLRSEAEEVAASASGLAAFAEQAEERAGLARAEAEEKAREAEHLEAEAAQRQRAAEESRQEYESMMRRADDVDPDVKDSQYPPVGEDAGPPPAAEGAVDEGATARGSASAGGAAGDDEAPMTRAERRRAREEAEARESEEASWASGPAAPVAGAAAAAAVGTAAWAHRDDATDAERERSARIASAADYRDATGEPEVTGQASGGGAEVSEPGPGGTGEDMSQQSRGEASPASDPDRARTADAAADAESPRGEWGGPREAAASEAVGSDAADETPTTEEGTTMAERPEGDESPTTEPETDEATRAEEDAPHETDLGSGMTMVADPDAYGSTEPVLADEQATPVEPERPERTGTGLLDRDPGDDGSDGSADEDVPAAGATADEHTSLQDAEKDDVDAVVLADTDDYAATEPELADGSHAEAREHHEAESPDDADRPGSIDDPGADDGLVAGDADDPEARDWGHDEGALLEENRDRGDRLAADREDLDRQAGSEPSAGTEESRAGDRAEETPAGDGPQGRRVSEFHEIRDGGFGVGSAAPLDDGAQPMDHPIAGYRDTMSFRTPGDPGYDDTDPDVWFYDEGAAERSGFHRSDG